MTESITRILVPVDFSAHSERASSYAIRLAGRLGASVELFHAVEDPFVSGAWTSDICLTNVPELLQHLAADAGRRLEAMKTSEEGQGVLITTDVRTGPPSRTIADHAREGQFNLIVIGSHGRTGLSRMVLGSVAERVLRRAHCPVLTIRESAVDDDETAVDAATAGGESQTHRAG